ncbi:pyridoxal-dependent decarboxylase [Erwinia sp. OLTSP20]|uniref:pyridoxal phosphate-dependent decarboxylase family protein n=1 Tax=unclassified Erwinia TaxID=2622719 RepID=UPI000C176A3F|nr:MULTISPECIES: aspartate aminotransferase family protein [unclassified Erwinia]PIJ48368.1 pyridoxal-dependent decarboxylase [Erwinia sp. OAMSP11]PIJ68483.1 pyridoxal-dependent decarboxylase [Erwinia sp. OLSSP12]PIJ78860.1 pyridoxal-dependent decarboxylase [Erwinia sp. OLCASP19]PIJ79777.1 pyridoxal-dependent decarboxylase [Erwinia sp. OLMTSP26]PIJ81279.1 pyridoxal-dependent decarboxylase [Erwinia sp. OLMDSP33]
MDLRSQNQPLHSLHTSSHPPTPYLQGTIFNDQQLSAWNKQTQDVLALMTRTVKAVEKPFSGIFPNELAQAFTGVDLEKPLGSNEAALAELSELYLRDAVWFHHPKYMAHLNCPVVLPSLLAEQVMAAVNSSVDTWDQSAGGTLIEQKVIDWTLNRIGLPADADGIFTSGGTQSNLMAMLLARDSWCALHHPGRLIKQKGLPPEAGRWRVFTSSLSHFSIQKSMAILGLGYDAVISVDHDENYRMDTAHLEREIQRCHQEGLIPIAVVATSGTTDFGSIDPLGNISALCKQYGLWMHVDAAYGCGLLVSEKHAQLLAGIETADSVTVDYHKSFFQTVSCGAFFVRNKQNLSHVTHHADYLNPLSAQQEGTPNLVNKSIQTTRRFDALKMWLTLRIMGPDALGKAFDTLIALTQTAHARLSAHPSIEVLHAPELTTQVFRYLPRSSADDEQVDAINAAIRKALFRSGNAVIAGTKVNGRQYLKFTLLNPATTVEDIDDVIALIVHYGREQLRDPALNVVNQ